MLCLHSCLIHITTLMLYWALYAHADLSFNTHSHVYMCESICVYLCTRRVCTPARCLSKTVSTKGCVPTLLYGGRVQLIVLSRKIQACQQQGCCFTAAVATSRHRCTNTGQLYDCWQDAAVLSVAGRGLSQCDAKMQTHEFLV